MDTLAGANLDTSADVDPSSDLDSGTSGSCGTRNHTDTRRCIAGATYVNHDAGGGYRTAYLYRLRNYCHRAYRDRDSNTGSGPDSGSNRGADARPDGNTDCGADTLLDGNSDPCAYVTTRHEPVRLERIGARRGADADA